MKKTRCPKCGKELINLSYNTPPEFVCDDCNLTIHIIPPESNHPSISEMIDWLSEHKQAYEDFKDYFDLTYPENN